MELCEHGNLDTFLQKKILTQDEILDVMIQLAEGVDYLHGKNIIHRDIKPLNMLVSGYNTIHVKLTDFDISKFLDEQCTTSSMSSNVGTPQFKAPEFFQRTADGKQKYHRHVNLYAVGLAYLALIQQCDTKKPLCAKLETFKDTTELHVLPIGQVISDRMKRNESELSVVTRNTVSSDAAEPSSPSLAMLTDIKLIIQNMTKVEAKDRFYAVEVVKTLKALRHKHNVTHNTSWSQTHNS